MDPSQVIYSQTKHFDKLYNVDVEDSCFGTRTVTMGVGLSNYYCDIDELVQLLKEDILKSKNSRSENELIGLKNSFKNISYLHHIPSGFYTDIFGFRKRNLDNLQLNLPPD